MKIVNDIRFYTISEVQAILKSELRFSISENHLRSKIIIFDVDIEINKIINIAEPMVKYLTHSIKDLKKDEKLAKEINSKMEILRKMVEINS